MNSTGVIFLILAIVALLALMYLCCWWYCTLRRCCGSAKHKKARSGPAYSRADSLPIEKEAYTPTNNNNNNNAVPYKSSLSVPSSKVKYPTAPVVDEAKMMKGPGLVLTENRYSLKGPPTADLKLQNTAPPSPPVDKKLSSGSLLSNTTPGYSITQMKERNYQPLLGYDRRSSASYGPDGSKGHFFNNSTVTATLASRKLSQFSEKSESSSVPWYNSEKRSVSPSPFRSASPFDASSRYSTTSNSDAKYTNIRSIGGGGGGGTNVTTTTTTKVIDVSGDPGEQTVTIRVKADEADKVSSILSNAVRTGELSSAEAVHQAKTVDVKKMTERYEVGKGGESGNDDANVQTTTTTTDLKSVGLLTSSDRLPSFVPSITTTTTAGDEANVQNIIEQVMTSVEESAPGYTVSKTVIVSSKEEGKVTETQLTTKDSSASLKDNHDSSS